MRMNSEFLTKVEKEEELLKEKLSSETEEIEFLDNFLTTNRFNDINRLLSVDLCDLAIAYICSNSDKLSYEEVKDKIELNKSYLKNIEGYDNGLVVILYMVSKDVGLNGSHESIKEVSEILKGKEKILDAHIKDMIEEINSCGNNIEELIELFKEDIDVMIDTIAFISVLEDMEKEFDSISDDVEKISEEISGKIGIKISEKTKDRTNKARLKEKFNLNNIQKEIETIENYYSTETKKRKNKNRKIRKQLEKYNEFKRLYQEELKKEEITKIDDLIEKIEDKNLRKELLVEIYNHNLPIQQKTEKEYNKLSSDYKNRRKLLLSKYKIEDYENKINNSIELDDLEYELKILNKIGFKDSTNIITIINNTTREIVENIDSLINNNVITKSFVIANINLFSKNLKTSAYPILLKNIKALKDKELNPKLIGITPDADVLLTKIELFNENLNALEEYNIKHLFKGVTSYKFLSEKRLKEKIDRILELGFERNLEESLNLLNYDDNAWNIVMIHKMIGEEIYSTEELLRILGSSNNWLKNKDINDYVFNFAEYSDNNELVSAGNLGSFSNTTRTYSFDGVLISKNKVERAIDSSNKIAINDITKNSILSEDEYNRIIKCLNHKIK